MKVNQISQEVYDGNEIINVTFYELTAELGELYYNGIPMGKTNITNDLNGWYEINENDD